MEDQLNTSNANRLAIGFARARSISYSEAEGILKRLYLRIKADKDSCSRASGQAAILTAFIVAQRAFLGGVEVEVDGAVPLKIPVPGATLGDAIVQIHPRNDEVPRTAPTVFVGVPYGEYRGDDIIAHADGWRGGSGSCSNPAEFVVGDVDDFALGGVFGGGSAVHQAFVSATCLPSAGGTVPFGISLWSPGSDWLKPESTRRLRVCPARLWVLGLGHLGQSYLWNLALLPFKKRSDVEIYVGDFDVIDESNQGSGMLCNKQSVGVKKTRHCASWLEDRGFETRICERLFGPGMSCTKQEPQIALSGFDNRDARIYLDKAGFRLVLDCGLGGSLADFDQIQLNVLPNDRKAAEDLWPENAAHHVITEEAAKLFGRQGDKCGQLAIDIAGKAVSTSFVGAMAGALSISELLRMFNQGPLFDKVDLNARNLEDFSMVPRTRPIRASELAQFGYQNVDARMSVALKPTEVSCVAC